MCQVSDQDPTLVRHSSPVLIYYPNAAAGFPFKVKTPVDFYADKTRQFVSHYSCYCPCAGLNVPRVTVPVECLEQFLEGWARGAQQVFV